MSLKSRWVSAAVAPYTAPMTPRTIRPGIQKAAPSGISWMPRRMMPNAPSFISTPACTIETAVGADMWPSGDHVWNGQSAASTPQPMTIMGKNVFWKVGLSVPSWPAAQSCWRSNVPRFASWKVAKMPIQMRTEPPTSMSVSLAAPYSLRVDPQTPMSR